MSIKLGLIKPSIDKYDNDRFAEEIIDMFFSTYRDIELKSSEIKVK